MDPSKIALFDMDGTLVDYDGHMRASLKELAGPNEISQDYTPGSKDPAYIKARKDLIRRDPGWWVRIPKFQLGWDVLGAALEIGFSPHILTKGPYKATNAWTEKVECCRRLLPNVPVTISQDKSIVYGRILVDDYPEYLDPWLMARPRAIAIVPAQPWNARYYHPRAQRYDGTNLTLVRNVMQEAFDRVRTK